MSDHDDVRDALHRLTPDLSVPDDLVPRARRHRQRTRGLMAGGALALVTALVGPLALNLGGGNGTEAVPASGPSPEVQAAAEQTGGGPSARPTAESGGPAATAAVEEGAAPTSVTAGENDATAQDRAAAAATRLGWDVIQASTSINRLVSPASLSMSLVQAAEGAQGASLASIDAALGLVGDARAQSFASLRESLSPYDSLPDSVDADAPPETPVVHQASRVLAIDAELKQPFLDRVARFYDAESESTTLADAKANLDAWAVRHTAGLIEESAITPEPDMVAVLQDALLFAAAWRDEFRYDNPIPFAAPDGEETMDGVLDTLLVAHAEGDRWSAVRLPYDDNLAADVVLPTVGVAPEELTVEELEAARLALDAANPIGVQVAMPTFALTSTTDLLDALPQIDLSNLNGIVAGGFAGEWVQQVKLIVTARGTVGAALTEMAVFQSGGGAVEQVFTVDRPYVFRVLDTRTGWPLFLAAISDPREES